MADKLLQVIGGIAMVLFVLCAFLVVGVIAIQGLGILVGVAGALLGIAIPLALFAVPIGLVVWFLMKVFSHECKDCDEAEHY
jgi:hypothetical protein